MPREALTPLQSAVLERMSPVDLVKGWMYVRSGSVGKWAKSHGWFPQHVYNTLEGDRAGEAVWDTVAEEIGITREELDRSIEQLTATTG